MNRIFARALASAAFFCIIATAMPHIARSAVKSASSDGEATVYLTGNFTAKFDVAYRATLTPAARNKSWSTLSILLIGSRIPGPGVSIGLMSGPKHRITPFTYVVYPNRQDDYRNQSANCRDTCVIELRGDEYRIYAYANSDLLATWSRSELSLRHPNIQLNAEAHGAGDTLRASLSRVRATAGGHEVPFPTCAFTTRGIEPAGRSTLSFTGTTNDAGGAFVNPETGAHEDRC